MSPGWIILGVAFLATMSGALIAWTIASLIRRKKRLHYLFRPFKDERYIAIYATHAPDARKRLRELVCLIYEVSIDHANVMPIRDMVVSSHSWKPKELHPFVSEYTSTPIDVLIVYKKNRKFIGFTDGSALEIKSVRDTKDFWGIDSEDEPL